MYNYKIGKSSQQHAGGSFSCTMSSPILVLHLVTRDNSVDCVKRVLRLDIGQVGDQRALKATKCGQACTIFEALESGIALGVVAEGFQSIQGG